MPAIAFVVFDGFETMALAAQSVFEFANRALGEPFYQTATLSEAGGPVTSSGGLTVVTDAFGARSFDTVIFVGSDPAAVDAPPGVVAYARAMAGAARRTASICTGAFVLAAIGALDGLRATTHWASAAELARRHPRIDVDPDVLYVDNGRILTSAGAAAGFDLCLYLVRKDLGSERAAAVARAAVMPLERMGGQAQFIAYEPAPDEAQSMSALLHWLEENLPRKLSLAAIARRAAMSTRTLSRQFRAHVGSTPAVWVARARVRRAQRLLETTDHSIERVAAEAGFGSAAVLRVQFQGVVGTSPQIYRRQFSPAASP
jgi:transcriptional regulator GlxA family with amidase domain